MDESAGKGLNLSPVIHCRCTHGITDADRFPASDLEAVGRYLGIVTISHAKDQLA